MNGLYEQIPALVRLAGYLPSDSNERAQLLNALPGIEALNDVVDGYEDDSCACVVADYEAAKAGLDAINSAMMLFHPDDEQWEVVTRTGCVEAAHIACTGLFQTVAATATELANRSIAARQAAKSDDSGEDLF